MAALASRARCPDVSELMVVGATVAAFIAGALEPRWWVPLVVAPPAAWAYAQVLAQAYKLERTGPALHAEALVGQTVNLYLAFALGRVIALLFGV